MRLHAGKEMTYLMVAFIMETARRNSVMLEDIDFH